MQTDISVDNYGKLWYFVHETKGSEEPASTPSKRSSAEVQAAKEANKAKWEAKKTAASLTRVRAPSNRQAALMAKQRQLELDNAANSEDEGHSDEEDLEPLASRMVRLKSAAGKPAAGEDDEKDKGKGVMVEVEKLLGKDNGDEKPCEAEHDTVVGSSNS